MSFLTKIFGSSNQRSLKRMQVIVDQINDLESDYQQLSDEELAGLRDKLKKNSAAVFALKGDNYLIRPSHQQCWFLLFQDNTQGGALVDMPF